MSFFPSHRIVASSVLVACSIVLAASLAVAGTTGKISGKVRDAQSHEPLIGVNVSIPGTTFGAVTDVDGNYFIINLAPGTYRLRGSGVGFAPLDVVDVKVFVDQTTKIDIELQQEAVQMAEVRVTAERPIVQKDLTSTTSTVSREQLATLPVEDIGAVINLQAGVVEGHFRGGRSNEVKYLVDGVPVNDVFSGGSTLQAEVNSIQEVQVLSGTFNAEYGEALSGVVNQVTKTAGENLSGDLSVYTGDYLSSRTSLFHNISHVSFISAPSTWYPFRTQNPALVSDLHNVEGSLSGPVPGTNKTVRFFVAGRYYYDDGYLYGRRMFNPSDSSNFSSNDPSKWYVGATGDNSYVPMNFQKRYTLQGKLSFALGSANRLTVQSIYQRHDYRDYDQRFQLEPDGDYKRFQKSFLGTAQYNYILNEAAFFDVSMSVFSSDFKQYVYENPLDPRYVNPVRMQDVGGNAFLTGGTQNWHFSHHTTTATGKLDFTDQITQLHQIKTGVEFQLHTLNYEDYQIHIDATTNFLPALPAPGSFDYNVYKNHPYQLAGYLQDKIELEYLVVNVGVRFDYFQPDGRVLRDAERIADLDTLAPPFPDSFTVRAKGKYQFSPRLGVSYPISDRGALHISYGHFFQIPAFEFLYKNPNYRIAQQGDLPEFVGNTIGNADLEPQRTTVYEIGLQQQIATDLGVTVTGYYKDIRNLLGLQVHEKLNFKKFGEYVNRDYGAVKGITLSFEKRLNEGFGATVDYTYQIAQGSASDPNADFQKAQATPPIATNKELVPLDWDRRHSLNFTFTLGAAKNYTASLIGRLGSGLPYTPSFQNQRTGLENSDNRPAFFNLDCYFVKELNIYQLPLSLYVKVYNVFDTPNEINIFTDTGRAGYTLELTRAQSAPRGVNTLAEYFTRPDFYSAPRQVLIGGSISF
ncbi:MAG TPA: TonB-dependent receptor [Bacteroidota bacterium]|nr:TonB-dependent receptor [Bacteroidota bacterium]